MDNVGDQIRVYQLEDKLLAHVNQVKNDLCSKRSKKSSLEFSEEKYPDSSMFSSGIHKQNVANYNMFISHFEEEIRVCVGYHGSNGSFGLIGAFRNEINEYVASITSLLVSKQVDSGKRDYFKQALLKELVRKLGGLNIIIKSNAIQAPPVGKQKNWSLYKTKFEKTFDDEYIDGLITQFKEVANDLSDPEVSLCKIQELRDGIEAYLQLTPAQKELEKKREQDKLSKLNDELAIYMGLVRQVKQLIESK